MPKNREKWIEIAYGEQGFITHWDTDFAMVMNQIDRYVFAIGQYQLDMNWKEICDRVPALRGKHWNVSKDETFSTYLASLESTMDCFLREDRYEDMLPGQSGPDLTLELQASKKRSFIRTMEQFLSSLEKYWKEHRLPKDI
jgi:hypothetical protein